MTDLETAMTNLAKMVAATGITLTEWQADLAAAALTNDELINRIDQAYRETHPNPRRAWIDQDDRRVCDPPTLHLSAETDTHPEPFIPRYATGGLTR